MCFPSVIVEIFQFKSNYWSISAFSFLIIVLKNEIAILQVPFLILIFSINQLNKYWILFPKWDEIFSHCGIGWYWVNTCEVESAEFTPERDIFYEWECTIVMLKNCLPKISQYGFLKYIGPLHTKIALNFWIFFEFLKLFHHFLHSNKK